MAANIPNCVFCHKPLTIDFVQLMPCGHWADRDCTLFKRNCPQDSQAFHSQIGQPQFSAMHVVLPEPIGDLPVCLNVKVEKIIQFVEQHFKHHKKFELTYDGIALHPNRTFEQLGFNKDQTLNLEIKNV